MGEWVMPWNAQAGAGRTTEQTIHTLGAQGFLEYKALLSLGDDKRR